VPRAVAARGFFVIQEVSMGAMIAPLMGKYYGTKIQFDNGGGKLTVWYMGNWEPSKRQLEHWGMTLEEARDDLMLSDSHFESEQGFAIAEAICKAINDLRFFDD
jgi:hypothetical protein